MREILVPRRGLAPPIGDDPTHKPLKTRLSLDFSSCNRRILVYGLVYDQDTVASATPPPRVTVYVPDPRLGFWGVNFAECTSKGAVDSFVDMERADCLCILLIRGDCYILLPPPR